MMRMGGAEDADYTSQCDFGAEPRVQGLNREPDGIDSDHPRTSRSQAALRIERFGLNRGDAAADLRRRCPEPAPARASR